MPRDGIEHVKLTTGAILDERQAALRELIPEAFTEGKLDIEKLRTTLGEDVATGPERYSFSWAGKREAIQLLQAPSRATLVPAPEESINFTDTGHIFIEGDNLEVLKLLRKSYHGQVKMIYIDPPYNTGNDFVYPDNFADPLSSYLQLTGQQDGNGNRLTSNAETSGRYHSAWLSMMYPRLFIARQLLREDGLILVSIDDNEVHNLRLLMNEVFGEENFVECFIWKKSYGGGAKEKYAVTQHEYVLTYARNIEQLDDLWLPPDPDAERRYYKYRDDKYGQRGPYRLKPLEATRSMDRRDNLIYPIPLPDGGEVWPKRQWWWRRERVLKAIDTDEIVFTHGANGEISVSYKQYLIDKNGDKRGAKPFSVIDGIYTQNGTDDLRQLFGGEVVVQFPKPVELMKKLLHIVTESNGSDIVIDFFAGSGTTAQALLEANHEDEGDRRFLLVQLPEPTLEESPASKLGMRTISSITKERIRRVIAKMKRENAGTLDLGESETSEDLGFRVFKLAESYFRQWVGKTEQDSEAYIDQMALFLDPLLDGWTEETVIWEVAVKEGYALTAHIERLLEITTNAIYRVTDEDKGQSFRICLDAALQQVTITTLALTTDDLFICRDVALTDDMAANMALQCRLKTI